MSAEKDRKLVHEQITSSKRGNLRSDHHGRRSRCQGLPSHFPLTPVGRGTAEVSAMIHFMSRNVIWNPFRGGFPQKWNETGRRKTRNDNNKDELTKCRHMVRWLFGRLRDEFKKKKKKLLPGRTSKPIVGASCCNLLHVITGLKGKHEHGRTTIGDVKPFHLLRCIRI